MQKIYKITINDLTIEVIQDNDGKFIKPSIIDDYNSFGTALKPALEPIVMARKPLDGTVAQNILEYGVGGINIDESRIPATDKAKFPEGDYGESNFRNNLRTGDTNINSRFPANFIHDGSDEVEALFPKEAGGGNSTYNFEKTNQQNTVNIITNIKSGHHFGDSGSAARFFYVAKASKEERNFGLYDFEEKQVGSLSGGNRKGELDDVSSRFRTIKKNIHPTVKPIELMRYLVRMITPPNGICLDAFLGSGTTAIAAKELGRDYIGFEIDKSYYDIAQDRLNGITQVERREKEAGVMDIFDFMEE